MTGTTWFGATMVWGLLRPCVDGPGGHPSAPGAASITVACMCFSCQVCHSSCSHAHNYHTANTYGLILGPIEADSYPLGKAMNPIEVQIPVASGRPRPGQVPVVLTVWQTAMKEPRPIPAIAAPYIILFPRHRFHYNVMKRDGRLYSNLLLQGPPDWATN